MILGITFFPRFRFGWLLASLILGLLLPAGDGESRDPADKVQRVSRLTLKKPNPNNNSSVPNDLRPEMIVFLRNLSVKHFTEYHHRNCSSLTETGLSALSDVLCQDLVNTCLSSEQLLHFSNPTKGLNENIAKLCPILLRQNSDSTEQPPPRKDGRPTSGAVWGYGILFVTIISCCSLVGVVLLPLLNKTVYQVTLMLFEGLAVGSLVGSSIFHLIPQTFRLVGQDAEHHYLWKSLIIFGGIYLFYLSERLMKIIINLKKRKKKEPKTDNTSRMYNSLAGFSSTTESSSSIALSPSQDKDNSCTLVSILPNRNSLDSHGYTAMANGNVQSNLACQPSSEIEVPHSHHHHEHAITYEKGQSTIGTVAWMIIFGDGLHNFIDGLSIGAAFSESVLAGISISVAVICEEFPHELGDFAVLLSAGMTMRQALMYNFLSACTCYLGLVFGVLLGDLAEGSTYIFALAAGMFLYISLVDMVGELGEALEEANQESASKALKVFLIQNVGILIGVVILFVMARYSELINFENFGEHSGDETTTSNSVKALYSGLYDEQQLGYV